MTEDSAAVEPAPSKAALALAWLPTVLAAVFLIRAENAVDGALCVVLLAHGPLAMRLPGMQRRRLLFAELPAILLGTFGIAALLVTGMASLLQAPVPWGQAVSFGFYMSIWVLSLRLIYQALNWSLQRCFGKRVSPRASLADLSAAVPVVLVHAGDDALIPVAHGQRLAAARAGLQLHVIDGAGHGGCLHAGWTRMKDLLDGMLEQVRRAR